MDTIEYLKERRKLLAAQLDDAANRYNTLRGGLAEIDYAIEQLTAPPTFPELYVVDAAGKELMAAAKGKDATND